LEVAIEAVEATGGVIHAIGTVILPNQGRDRHPRARRPVGDLLPGARIVGVMRAVAHRTMGRARQQVFIVGKLIERRCSL
jgi:hypothetical protein